jgi:hypothetical protein
LEDDGGVLPFLPNSCRVGLMEVVTERSERVARKWGSCAMQGKMERPEWGGQEACRSGFFDSRLPIPARCFFFFLCVCQSSSHSNWQRQTLNRARPHRWMVLIAMSTTSHHRGSLLVRAPELGAGCWTNGPHRGITAETSHAVARARRPSHLAR